MIQKIKILFFFFLLFACEQKDEKEIAITPPESNNEISGVTVVQWNDAKYLNSLGREEGFAVSTLTNGGPAEPLYFTYNQANLPVALFQASTKSIGQSVVSPVAFLSFKTEESARVSVRHIKSLNCQNVSSQVILPQDCPESYLASVDKNVAISGGQSASAQVYCLPLINAAVPGFLVPTDNGGAYVHEFIISSKTASKTAGVLSTKVASRIVIPGSRFSVKSSSELRSLSLRDRLTIATNDLLGSPRRDFKVFEVVGEIPPQVKTEVLLDFSNVKMTVEQEVFFEQPVLTGSTPTKPLVARGSFFGKRKTVIDSVNHFRLRIINGQNESEIDNLSSTGNTLVRQEIVDPTAPIRFFISPDFASELASKSMSEYVKPFSPFYCVREQASFKPEEWRQNRNNPDYVACEGIIRDRIVDFRDRLSKGVTIPLETFFGSFSYMPQLGSGVIGGTHGILSMRISISGSVKASVRNPHDLSTTTEVGSIPLDFTYQFPTALQEMEDLIRSGKATTGMDTILSSMQRKGILELPRRENGAKPAFPFMKLDREDIFY